MLNSACMLFGLATINMNINIQHPEFLLKVESAVQVGLDAVGVT